MTNILISGYSGFVASNLVPFLKKSNYKVTGISRNKSHNTITYEDLSKDKWNNCYAFIHLAGKAHDLKNVSNSESYNKANRDLTITLFDFFLKSKASLFLYFSSVKAVADRIKKPLTESYTPNPITAYGKSKLEAENYILSKKLPNNKKVYILRPCMIHGPNNKGNLNILYSLISKGIPYPLGKYDNKRSFLGIDNLNFLMLTILNKKPESGIYNLSDDQAISTIELVEIIASNLGKQPKIWNIPKPIINTLGKIGQVFNFPFSSSNLEKLTENYEVDNTKIKSNLKIQLPKTTQEGLIKTLNSFKK